MNTQFNMNDGGEGISTFSELTADFIEDDTSSTDNFQDVLNKHTDDLLSVIDNEDGSDAGSDANDASKKGKKPVVDTTTVVDNIDNKDDINIIDTTIDAATKDKSTKNTPTTDPYYKNFINKMVDAGHWDAIGEIEFEDGTTISFEDAEVDEELFNTIVENQVSSYQEKLLKDKVSLEGTSDFTKQLIDIEKKGGNVTQALQFYQEFQDPLSRIDIGTERGQIEALSMLLQQRGLEEDSIRATLIGYKQQGMLETKGEEAYNALNKVSEDYMKGLADKAAEAKIRRVEEIKKYKKELESEITSKFQVSEALKRKLVEAATKEDKEGKFEIDKTYFSKRRDPKEANELAFFLYDKDAYLKQKFEELKHATNISTLKTIKLTAKKQGGTFNTTRQDGRGKAEDISLDDI